MAVLVGKPAPDFRCAAVLGNGEITDNFHLASTIHNKYALLFFYPLDFTLHCSSELLSLNEHIGALTARGVEVISISVDSHFTHDAWRKATTDHHAIGTVCYTMATDLTHHIVRDYDVQADSGVAYRATFLIDPRGVVRSQLINDFPLSRNMDEILRLIDALQNQDLADSNL